jgi:hypothetical protein
MQPSEGNAPRHRQDPNEPLQCTACGSTWFHELSVMEYAVMDGQWLEVQGGRLGVLVCLCGSLQRPRLASGRESVRQIFESFSTSFELAEDVHWLDDIAEKYGWRLLPRGADFDMTVGFLNRIAQEVEQYAGRARLKRVAGITNSRREPAGSGKDVLVVDLQRRGFRFRQARGAVDAVFRIWRDALARHEPVETPAGWLEVQRSRRVPRERVRFGKQQMLYGDDWGIALTRTPKRLFAADTPAGTWNEESRTNRGDPMRDSQSEAICERCAGRWFAETDYKRYRRYAYGSLPGSELQQVSENTFYAMVCLCGHPLALGKKRAGGEEMSDFVNAVEAARRVRDQRARFEDELKRLEAGFVSSAQAQTMLDKIAALQRQLDALHTARSRGAGDDPRP